VAIAGRKRSATALAARAALLPSSAKQGGLQFGEGLGAGIVVIGLQLFGEQADGGGELLGLDGQLPVGSRFARRTFMLLVAGR
jgi:hypothetical protein